MVKALMAARRQTKAPSGDCRFWAFWRGTDLWRRRNYPRYFGAFGA
jgi:hypothetical protein